MSLEKKQKHIAEQMLFGCKRTEEEEVTVQLSQVTMILGVDKVEKILLNKTVLNTKRKVRRKVRRGLTALATFNRLELIDAIESTGLLDEGTTSVVPVKRFAAGTPRKSSTIVRDAWAD